MTLTTVQWRKFAPGLALVCLMAFAALLRLWGLTSESLWQDEILTVDYVERHDLLQIIVDTFRVDFHPFAYYALLKVWTLAFGSSDLSCRTLSALIGCAGVLATYWLALAAFGNRGIALLSGLVTAVLPAQVWYSQECRMYSLVALSWATSLHALLSWERSGGSLSRGLVLCLSFILFAYSHAASGLLGLPFFLAVLLVPVDWGASHPRPSLRRRLVLSGALVAAYIPWVLRLVLTEGELRHLGTLGPGSLIEYAERIAYMNVEPTRLEITGYWFFVVFCGFWVGAAALRRQPVARAGEIRYLSASIVLPLAAAVVASHVRPFHQTRNLLFLIVPMTVLGAGFVAYLYSRLRTPTRRAYLARTLCLALLLLSLALGLSLTRHTLHNLMRPQQKEDWRGVTARLLQVVEESDRVLFYSGHVARCARFYARHTSAFDALDVYPLPRESRAAADSVKTLLRADGRTPVWLVQSYVSDDAVATVLGSYGYEAGVVEDFGPVALREFVRDDEE